MLWPGARSRLRAPLTPLPRWRRRPQVSFGTIGLSVGLTLLLAGFLGYFNFVKISDNSLSALLLIYGFPISLIGNPPRAPAEYDDARLTRARRARRLRAQVC